MVLCGMLISLPSVEIAIIGSERDIVRIVMIMPPIDNF